MSFHAKFRIVLNIGMFASVFLAPPWLVAIFAFGLAARFRAWEVLAAGILMDFVWMPHAISIEPISIPAATMVAIVLVLGLEPLRRQLLVDIH